MEMGSITKENILTFLKILLVTNRKLIHIQSRKSEHVVIYHEGTLLIRDLISMLQAFIIFKNNIFLIFSYLHAIPVLYHLIRRVFRLRGQEHMGKSAG